MKKLIILSAVIFSAGIVSAQWQQCNLGGGNISDIIVDDSVVFAGVNDNGVYKSTDHASNWVQSSSGMTGTNFIHLANHGTDIYASGSQEIFRSTDNGANWTSVFNMQHNVWAMIALDTVIFAATPDGYGYLYSSADSGLSWNLSNNGMDSISVYSLGTDGTNLFAGTDTGFYKSTNTGINWFRSSAGLPQQGIINAIAANDAVIYICFNSWDLGCQIYKSTDEGANWTLAGTILTSYLNDIVINDSKVYVASQNGVYLYDGLSWTQLTAGLSNPWVNTLAVAGTDLLAGTHGGVFMLANNSTNWVMVSNGISASTIRSIANFEDNLLAGVRDNGVLLTTDHGNTWISKNNGINDLDIGLISSKNEVFLISNHEGVYRSQDMGDHWELENTGVPYNQEAKSILTTDTNVYIGFWGGLHRSADNGITWFESANGLPSDPSVLSLTINSRKELFAVVSDAGLYKSTDNGANWSFISSTYPNISNATIVTACDTSLIAAISWNPPVVFSNDNGLSWNIGNNGLFGHSIRVLKTIGNIVIAGLADGVAFTKNNGVDWNFVTDNLPVTEITAIGKDDIFIYVGVSGHSIWKRPIADFGIDFSSVDQNKISESVFIFPNPATNLLYINCEEKAKVEILNLQGQIVATKMLSGKNESIDVSGLVQGVYMVKVKTENGVITKKIVKQ